jgi:methionyl-tRNA synthetase
LEGFVVRNCYLTTPIYYVTAKPHLGHAYTTVVADALARWHRLQGEAVHFLTGTDEHGLKVQQYALAAGKSPQAFVDDISPLYEQAWRRLHISHDDFIRTTEPRHRVGVEALLQRCYEAGDIELGLYAGKYCVACEEYYTDEELDPAGLCRIHRQPVDYYEEENYFFRLSRFQDRLLDWYDTHPDAIVPAFRRNEVLGVIRSGLRDFSVSRRSLTWGIPLPWDARHVAYVWFDALANYVSAIGFGQDDERFATWWPARHLLGKDILRHHCIYWPAMLMSVGLPLPAGWAIGGHLLSGGQKMSKTTGNVVSPLELADDVGVDAFRYYLLAETPYGNDGDFSYDGLVRRYNSDLANNLGNLVSRVATVVAKKCDGIGPAPGDGGALSEAAAAAVARATEAWSAVAPSEALEGTWSLVRAANAHLERHQPWKEPCGPAVDRILGNALEALRIIAILASPALPDVTQTIWERLGLSGRADAQRLPAAARWGGYPDGARIVVGTPLFPRRVRPECQRAADRQGRNAAAYFQAPSTRSKTLNE